MLPMVLILDSTYKTNKYRLPLMEMVGVTSTEEIYSIEFAFLECEKEDNFTWALEVCQTLLKDQGEMPKEIVTEGDTTLMNSVATIFLSSNALLCRYDITKNVTCFHTLRLSLSYSSPSYKARVMHKKVCEKYPDLLKYVESTTLDEVKKQIVCAWTDNVRHIGKTTTNRVESAHATLKKWLGNRSDSIKCGCTIVKTYCLPCARVIAKKVKLGDMKPPSQPVKTKGAPKKMKPTLDDNSATRIPSYFEHVDKVYPTHQLQNLKKSVVKGAHISKPPLTPPPPKISFIDEMTVFMHKYIEMIVNVEGDGSIIGSVLKLIQEKFRRCVFGTR
ncbi:uncharacterized protein LOC127101927 [Lathyrus oleraceus]|uniref:uncharacterized protein LOC127101927 n=1 Tax=Pisum sativum TaxID=3888 RepID=UPI0021D2C0AA|nr:uncharacterized protein LOC127101927 [Pisum sativum]